jgi:DNA-binding CsgD family transcriptional regulator
MRKRLRLNGASPAVTLIAFVIGAFEAVLTTWATTMSSRLFRSAPARPPTSQGNATGAQRRRRGRPGQAETIAERRAVALELRKAGGSYRQIAQQLGVDVHTMHGDVGAELAALRETTIGRAEELRALELERFDRMVAGLWPQIEKGSPPAVTAAVRVSERRARLLGLDEPTATRTELSGSLSVTAEKLAAERELFG